MLENRQISWWYLFKALSRLIAPLFWFKSEILCWHKRYILFEQLVSNAVCWPLPCHAICSCMYTENPFSMILWPQSLFFFKSSFLCFDLMIWNYTRTILYSAFSAFIVRWFFFSAAQGKQTPRLLSLLWMLFPLNQSPTKTHTHTRLQQQQQQAVTVAFLLIEVFSLPLLCWPAGLLCWPWHFISNLFFSSLICPWKKNSIPHKWSLTSVCFI